MLSQLCERAGACMRVLAPCMCVPQEVGGTFIREDWLVVMAGMELVECYQIHQTHGFHVFDAIPSTPFQPLL